MGLCWPRPGLALRLRCSGAGGQELSSKKGFLSPHSDLVSWSWPSVVPPASLQGNLWPLHSSQAAACTHTHAPPSLAGQTVQGCLFSTERLSLCHCAPSSPPSEPDASSEESASTVEEQENQVPLPAPGETEPPKEAEEEEEKAEVKPAEEAKKE